jgi:hypothetical protein
VNPIPVFAGVIQVNLVCAVAYATEEHGNVVGMVPPPFGEEMVLVEMMETTGKLVMSLDEMLPKFVPVIVIVSPPAVRQSEVPVFAPAYCDPEPDDPIWDVAPVVAQPNTDVIVGES